MLEGKNNWKAWLYLLPALVLLGVFSFYPIVKSFIIAFIRDYSPVASTFAKNRAENAANGLSLLTFINFKAVVTNEFFGKAVLNTLLIAFLSVPISVIIALVVSVLLNSIKRVKGFFQTLFFLPYVTSAMAVSMAFTVLFANSGPADKINLGPVNTVVTAIGAEKPLMKLFDNIEWKMQGNKQWRAYICEDKSGNIIEEDLDSKYSAYKKANKYNPDAPTFEDKYAYQTYLKNDEKAYSELRNHFENLGYIDWVGAKATWSTAIFVVLLYSIWSGLAFKILVFTGGLTSIDKQYYDAAKIDATSKWRTFWRITVPMMSPLITYILITSLIGSFKTYTSIVGLFGDTMGPAGQKGLMMTFVGMVYQYMGEGNSAIHIGAASAVTLFLIVFVVTQITNTFTKKKTHY